MADHTFANGSEVIEVYGQPLRARRRTLVRIKPVHGDREVFESRGGLLEGRRGLDLVVVPCDGSHAYPCKIQTFQNSWAETEPGSGIYRRQAMARVVPIPEDDQVVLQTLEGEMVLRHPDFIAIGIDDEVYGNSANWVQANLEFLEPCPST